MFRLVVAVMAGFLVLAGWRNLPPIDQPSAGVAGLLLAGAVLGAFFMGRRSVKAEAFASAVASARAEAAAAAHAGAQSVAQVVVNVDGESARSVAATRYGQPEWIGSGRVDVSQLDGSDAVESITEEVREAVTDGT